MSTQPSQEALKLAEQIEAREWPWPLGAPYRLDAIARFIDEQLQLPARNAALLCAQGVLDAYERYDDKMDCWDESTLNELREALARIGAKP